MNHPGQNELRINELEKRVDKAMGLLGGVLAVIAGEFGQDKVDVIFASAERAAIEAEEQRNIRQVVDGQLNNGGPKA